MKPPSEWTRGDQIWHRPSAEFYTVVEVGTDGIRASSAAGHLRLGIPVEDCEFIATREEAAFLRQVREDAWPKGAT